MDDKKDNKHKSNIFSWLNMEYTPEDLLKLNLKMGAGQIRHFGRLALFRNLHITDAKNRKKDKTDK